MTNLLAHGRRHAIPYLALLLVLALGGRPLRGRRGQGEIDHPAESGSSGATEHLIHGCS